MKINSRKELQNISINNSADINYNDFMRIYRKCTRKLIKFFFFFFFFFFLTTDTLPAVNPLRFKKHFFQSYKSDSS